MHLIICISLVCLEGTQENLVTPQNGPSHHLKCHLQLTTTTIPQKKMWVEEANYQEKHSKQGYGCSSGVSYLSIDMFLEI